MKRKTLLAVTGLLLAALNTFAQTLPSSRSVDWTLAGVRDTSLRGFTHIDMQAMGAVGDSISPNDSVLSHVLDSLPGSRLVLNFPQGHFLFNKTMHLPANTVIRGSGAEKTQFIFDLGGSGHAINIQGSSRSNDSTSISLAANKDSSSIQVRSAAGFSVGDWIKIVQNDTDLVSSTWATNSVGQIVQISAINGNNISLASPLRMDYDLARTPYIHRLEPIENVGIECLKILRLDDTAPQQSCNINMKYAANCWVTGIESENCTYSHLQAVSSSNIYIARSYFHHGFSYGGGGRAYGVMLHSTTNECRIEDNIFEHLRHSMIVQAGANANVFAYNYSFDPIRTEWPSNSSGELVLHGNYVYGNLFEQNLCQNIIIDNSHGPNGPYNTFFRNRADGFGIMFTASNSPDQNLLGNDITNTGFPQSMVNYNISGTGHFLHGNNNKGSINPTGTSILPDESYAYSSRPNFVPASQWAKIGTPNNPGAAHIPAYERYHNGNIFSSSCSGTAVPSPPAPQAVKFIYDGAAWHPDDPSGMGSTAEDTIEVQAGTAAITDTTFANRLIVRPGAALDVSGNVLSVQDSAILEADSTGYAQVLGKIEGHAEWQRYLKSDSPRWYNTAFPVKGVVADLKGPMLNLSGNPQTQNIYRYDAALDTSADGEGEWIVAQPGDTLANKAYQIFLSQHYGGNSALLSAFGTLQDGDQSLPIYRDVAGANANGWNYIPNPFPSNLSFVELAADNPNLLTRVYYIPGGKPGRRVFTTYSALAAAGTNGGTAVLPPGQAFFVQADPRISGSANLIFHNSQRVLGPGMLMHKQAFAQPDLVKLSVKNSLNGESDETILGFGTGFDAGVDPTADAVKMPNIGYPNFYTKINGEAYVYNFLESGFTSHSEPLYFEAPANGSYEIKLERNDLLLEWSIMLEDKHMGTMTDLRTNGYSFAHDTTNANERFVLHINTSDIGLEEEKASAQTTTAYTWWKNDVLMIKMEAQQTAVGFLELYDMSGKLILKKKAQGSLSELDLSSFPTGVYILNITSDSGERLHVEKIAH